MLQASVAQPASPQFARNPIVTLNPTAIRDATLVAVTAATLLQLAFFFTTDNLIASALLLCGAFVGLTYSVNRQLLLEYPISTLSIVGYTVFHFVVPPLGKLFDLQSINHNLRHPVLVWGYGIIGLLTLVVAHYAYRKFFICSAIRRSLANRFYRPLHFFDTPDNLQFWLLGVAGVAANLIVLRGSHNGQVSTLASLVRPLGPLIYTPYFTAYPHLIDPRYESRRQPVRVSLIAYSILLLALAAMINSRSFMLIGFVSLAVLYGYRVVTGTVPPPRLTFRSFMALVICSWLITGPITNLAASMLIVRGSRATASPEQLLGATWDAYRSGVAVRMYEMLSRRQLRLGGYSETYYNNIFLNRIGNVRFVDISIAAAQGVMERGDVSYFRRSEGERIVAILPAPIIHIMHLKTDKKKVLSSSSEDTLYHLGTGMYVSSFLTGSPLVILRTTFGLVWPICFGILAALVFGILDASSDLLSFCDKFGKRIFDCVIFNPIVAGTLFASSCFFTAFGAQNVATYIETSTRGWIQVGLLYAGAFALTKTASSLILGWDWQRRYE